MECPVCKTKATCKDIVPMDLALINILLELEVQFNISTCQNLVPLCSLCLHVSECLGVEKVVYEGEINTHPVSTSTVQHIVNAPTSEPLTATEEDILMAHQSLSRLVDRYKNKNTLLN